LWGPEYCTPVRVARRDGGALVVNKPVANEVLDACRKIATEPQIRKSHIQQARYLHEELFNPDRLQDVFVRQLEKLAAVSKNK